MIEIKKLNAFYSKHKALENINLLIENGKFHVVIGRNGSGKSTLIDCISGNRKYDGSVEYDGADIEKLSVTERAKKISLLSQQLQPVPFTVYELCSFGRNPHKDLKNSGEKVISALEKADITHLSDKRVDELSGGERQLSYFAMNICQDSDTMLLDEPAANLDMEHEEKILSLAKDACQNGKTVICVMHNLSTAVKYADRIIVLDRGKCIFSGTKNKCLEENIIEKNFGVKRFDVQNEIFFSI